MAVEQIIELVTHKEVSYLHATRELSSTNEYTYFYLHLKQERPTQSGLFITYWRI